MAGRHYNLTSQHEGHEPVTQLLSVDTIPATLSVSFAFAEMLGAGPPRITLEPAELKEVDAGEDQAEARRGAAQWKAEDAILAFKDAPCSMFDESLSTLIQQVLCDHRADDELASDTCITVARELRVLGTTLAFADGHDEGEIRIGDLGYMLQSIARRLEVAAQLDGRLRKIVEHEKALMIARAHKKQAAKEAS